MNANTIVQFECFETNIGKEEFVRNWQFFAQRLRSNDAEITLQEQVSGRGRYKYVSQHEFPMDGFQFSFMQGRYSENFPEANVKLVQAGGYTVLQMECEHDTEPEDVKILLFLRNETQLRDCKHAPSHLYQYLNIYQPYFESCLFAYIVEFYVKENAAEEFIAWIKKHTSIAETGIYKECLVLNHA